MTGQRLHPQRLRGVMAGEEDVQPPLDRLVEVGVAGLPGDKGVQPRLIHLIDHRDRKAGDAADPMGLRRAVGQHPDRRAVQRLDHPSDQGGDLQRRLQNPRDADLHPVVLPKGAGLRQPQEAGQFGVVAHIGVSIQRKMGRVEAAPPLDEGPHPPVEGADQPIGLVPEQPVVHNEELRAGLDGPLEGGEAGVHSEGDLGDLLRPLHLQAVLGGVLDLGHPQVGVEISDQSIPFHRTSSGRWGRAVSASPAPP